MSLNIMNMTDIEELNLDTITNHHHDHVSIVQFLNIGRQTITFSKVPLFIPNKVRYYPNPRAVTPLSSGWANPRAPGLHTWSRRHQHLDANTNLKIIAIYEICLVRNS